MPRKIYYNRKVGGASLLSGDLMSMLGGPSIGMTAMPLQGIFDAVLGPGAFDSFRNTGTKMLLDTVVKGATDGALKGVIGKGRPRGRPRKLEGEGMFSDYFHGISPAKRRQLNAAKKNQVHMIDLTTPTPAPTPAPAKGSGRPRKHKVVKACSHKHQNKCKCPAIEGGAGPLDFFKELDLPNTGQKLANSAFEVLMKRVLAGGAQPLDAPVIINGRLVGGRWTDYINPAWYFKKTMQKVVEPVLHATKLDKVVGAIPGVNLVAAMTGAIKPPGMPTAPPAAAAATAPPAAAKAGAGRRGRGRPRKVRVVGDDYTLVSDLEGGAIPDFEEMTVPKLRQLYKALEQQPQLSKEQLISVIEPFFQANVPRRQRTPSMTPPSRSPSPSPAPSRSPSPSKAKPKDAAYYRERYARRKAEKEMKVKEI